MRLVKDRFATQFVGSVVQQLEDDLLGVYLDRQGEESPLGVAFYRGDHGPVARTYATRNPPPLGQKNSPFYRGDFDDVFRRVDEHIARLQRTGKTNLKSGSRAYPRI